MEQRERGGERGRKMSQVHRVKFLRFILDNESSSSSSSSAACLMNKFLVRGREIFYYANHLRNSITGRRWMYTYRV
jgi:hypothetical protein